MSFQDSIRKLADNVRKLRKTYGLNTLQITVRTITWGGGSQGEGSQTNSDLALSDWMKVRELTSEEVAGSGGRYERGDLRVGPIAPPYTGGGFSIAQLDPTITDGQEVQYLVSGAYSGVYRLVSTTFDGAFSWFLVIRNTRRSP